jgi:hypothetical protein
MSGSKHFENQRPSFLISSSDISFTNAEVAAHILIECVLNFHSHSYPKILKQNAILNKTDIESPNTNLNNKQLDHFHLQVLS